MNLQGLGDGAAAGLADLIPAPVEILQGRIRLEGLREGDPAGLTDPALDVVRVLEGGVQLQGLAMATLRPR